MLLHKIGALFLIALLPTAPEDPPVVAAAISGDIAVVRSLLQQGHDVNAAQGDGMTALHWAAMRNDAEMARMLVYAGANVTATTRLGAFTPLLVASQNGHASIIEILLEAGSAPNSKTSNGASPLHLAAAAGQVDAIAVLLDHGAEVNAVESAQGQTPLIFAAANGRAEAIELLLKRGADASIQTTVVDIKELASAASAERRRWSQIVAAQRAGTERAQGAGPGNPTEELQGSGGAGDGGQARGGRGRGGGARGARGGRGGRGRGGNTRGGRGRGPRPTQAQTPPREQASSTGAGIDKLKALLNQLNAGNADGRGGAEGAQRGRAARPTSESVQNLETLLGQLRGSYVEAVAQGDDLTAADPTAELQGRGGRGGRGGGRGGSRRSSYTDMVGKTGGLTALLHASRQGHLEAAKALLAAGADINQQSAGDQTSPLLIAIINGRFDLAVYLLEQGADPNQKSHAGVAPLYAALNVEWAPHAFYPQPSTRQEKASHLEMMEALLTAGADPNARLDMKVWYSGYNFDQSGVNETGATAFWRAAQSSDVEAMRLLVAHGADPRIANRESTGPARRPPGGGNPEASNDERPAPIPVGSATSALHVATGAGFDGNFHRNAPYGWLPAAKYLIEELGFDVNARDPRGYTTLHHAAFRGDNEMILYLVEKGGDVMVVARSGQTTVDMANGPIQRLQPYPKTIKLLEGMGAKNNHRAISR